MTFFDGTVSLGTVSLSRGFGYLPVVLEPGKHEITARYEGTRSFRPSLSTPVTIVVDRGP